MHSFIKKFVLLVQDDMALATHLVHVARTNLAVRSLRVLFYTDIFLVPSKFGDV